MSKKILELVMIVKNSGEILRDCLKHNKQFIDYWTILDTGSTDNTIDIINEELKDVPGKLYHGQFIDFAQARNQALDLASNTCKYIINLDDSYKIINGNILRKKLTNSKCSCFLIKIGNLVDGFLRESYFSKRIIRSTDNLRYKFRVHEDIDTSPLKRNKEQILQFISDKDAFISDLTCDTHSARSRERYKKDIDMLLLDYKDNPSEQRVIYYLAKTYYMIEDNKSSLKYYEKIKQLDSAREDFLFAAYYDSACINYSLDKNYNLFRENLNNISIMFPNRAETFFKLAVIEQRNQNYQIVEELINKIIRFPIPVCFGTLIELDIYEYYIPFMYIENNIMLGKLDLAISMLKSMLQKYPCDQPLLNIKYNICDNLNISSIQLAETGKTIVIHTGNNYGVYCWNPNSIDQRISGSEIMAVNLAKEFRKYNDAFRIFIIGSFEDKEKNINYEGIYDNIQYIDYKYFSEFALKYIIDHLIVSRYTANLIYYDNIKSVYLWVHDILPQITDNSKFVQFHKQKFKGIVAVSKWQKDNIIEKLDIDEDKISVFHNSIYMSRFFNSNITKIPFRFIYSSCTQRGIDTLIKMIQIIKQRYNQTTLQLFVNKSRIDKITLDQINKLDYVFLNDRVSQEQLGIEFLKTDIWLYPTHFPETYCITAVEAMAAKCLIVTTKTAALTDLVNGRGILCEGPLDTDKNFDKMLEKLYFILERPQLKEHMINKAFDFAKTQSFTNLVNKWLNLMYN